MRSGRAPRQLRSCVADALGARSCAVMEDTAKRKAVLAFLECYRDLPVLWDVRNPEYYRRPTKTQAYNKLLVKFREMEPNATRETIVKKINSLRSAFRKELRKVREAAQYNELYVPSLWYFQELMFLVEHESPSRESAKGDGEELYVADVVDDYIEVQEDFDSHLYDGYDVPSATIAERNPKRAKTDTAEDDSLSKASSLCHEDDELLTMAKGFTYKLKKMTPHQRLFAERLINEVLLEGQLGNLRKRSSINVDGVPYLVSTPSTSMCTATSSVPSSSILSSCLIKQERDVEEFSGEFITGK